VSLTLEERNYLWKMAELHDVTGPDRGLVHRVLEALEAAEQRAEKAEQRAEMLAGVIAKRQREHDERRAK
jgi:hypothetical protein